MDESNPFLNDAIFSLQPLLSFHLSPASPFILFSHSLSLLFVPDQEPRYKDPSEAFDSGVDGLTADTSSPSQVSSLLWFPGASRAQSSGALYHPTSDVVRQNIYENFMRELETGTGPERGGGGGGGRGAGERGDPSTGTEEGESSSESAEGSLEQLDLLFEKEQGVVRRAGWLSFKPLLTLHKDRKLELVTRRKWKHYWVMLKGELGLWGQRETELVKPPFWIWSNGNIEPPGCLP